MMMKRLVDANMPDCFSIQDQLTSSEASFQLKLHQHSEGSASWKEAY